MAGFSSITRLLQRRQLSNILNLINNQSSFAAVRVSTPKILATLHGKGSKVQVQKDFHRHDSSCVKRTDLNFNDVLTLLGSGNLQLIDVREPSELVQQGEFPSALNIPLSCLKETLMLKDERFTELFNMPKPRPHDADIVFVGFGPIKSNTALEIAHKMGFKKCCMFIVGQLGSALDMAPHTFKALYGGDKPELDDDNIVFACYAGIRSVRAMSIAHEIGYSKARQYAGGFKEWMEKTVESEV